MDRGRLYFQVAKTIMEGMVMSKSVQTIVGMVVILAGVVGCATLVDVIREKDEGSGTVQVYPVTADQGWQIAKTVFRWEGSDAIEEHRDKGYMLTSSGMNLVSFGTVMGAWIEPISDQQTKVTVVTKRRVQTNIFTTLMESTFHRRFAQGVQIIKAGKPLPLLPPE
jgi:hypothetical protein